MRQSVLSVVLEVEPESCDRLSLLIEQLRHQEEDPATGYIEEYGRLKTGVPALHFMSINVFPSADYDPIFVIEANFDGPSGVFWGQLEATLGPQLRDMLRCCKKPADEDGDLYLAVTALDSRYPLAPYFEARTLHPSAFHQGNRGLDRDRILNEGDLFLATRTELAQSDHAGSNSYRGMTAQQIHKKLRDTLKQGYPWLDEPAPTRISIGERISDLVKFITFLYIVLFVLSIPGLLVLALLWIFAHGWTNWLMGLSLLSLVVYLALLFMLYLKSAARAGEAAPTRTGGLTLGSLSIEHKLTSLANPITFAAALIFLVGIYGIPVTAIGAALATSITGKAFQDLWSPTFHVVSLGLVSGLLVASPAIVLWLRVLERRDSYQDAPPVNERLMREMEQREDWIPQNHMGSVVLVKPGVLRMVLFRAGHLGLGLLLRLIATDGYLGSMRTIHFAHWAFINNASRLMFFSNFDHSWESYLDDFIEKAHGGLTLAWSSGVGFPPTRFLVLDGASHGRKFKAWARHSMAVSGFWFSAYKNYTVDQIERQGRIANGLRKATLTAKEAAAWARDL